MILNNYNIIYNIAMDDKLVYVDTVFKDDLLESKPLRHQAENESKKQLAYSTDMKHDSPNTITSTLDANCLLNPKAEIMPTERGGTKSIIPAHAGPWEESWNQADYKQYRNRRT